MVMLSHGSVKRPSQYLIYGSLISFGLLLLCVFIRPDSLSVDNGLSYFGIYKLTVIPYGAALLLYAFCLWKASAASDNRAWQRRILSWSLKLMALLVVGILATPDTFLGSLHMFLGSSLFILQLILSLLLLKWLTPHLINFALFGLELLSGIAAWYYLPLSRGPLLQTQVVFQLAFIGLLARTIRMTAKSSSAKF